MLLKLDAGFDDAPPHEDSDEITGIAYWNLKTKAGYGYTKKYESAGTSQNRGGQTIEQVQYKSAGTQFWTKEHTDALQRASKYKDCV